MLYLQSVTSLGSTAYYCTEVLSFPNQRKIFFEITAKEIYYGASGKNWCLQDKDKWIWSHLAPLGFLIVQSYSLELHHKTCTQDSYTSVSCEFCPVFLWSTSIGCCFIPKIFTLLSQVVWKLLLVLLTILAETYNNKIVIFWQLSGGNSSNFLEETTASKRKAWLHNIFIKQRLLLVKMFRCYLMFNQNLQKSMLFFVIYFIYLRSHLKCNIIQKIDYFK